MCGRYYFDIYEEELREIIEGFQKDLSEDFKTGEVFPSEKSLIMVRQGDKTRPIVAKWGFEKLNHKGLIINARAETLSEKPMFQKLVKYNRCIVPASGFFEWDKSADGTRNKYYFEKPNSILYMAGLFGTYHPKAEQLSLFDNNIEQVSYVIITRNANEYMEGIHNRMPLIFTGEEMKKWLRGESVNSLTAKNQVVLTHTIIS